MENMILSAIDKGLTNISFTEHMDYGYPYLEGEEGIFDLNTDAYLYELLTMRAKYEDKIRVGFGVELGLDLDEVRNNAIYAKSHEFDLIIASIHTVDKVDPYYPEYFKDKTEEEAYGLYFTRMYENLLKFENFDVLGHIDYIVRYGPNKDENYRYEVYKDTIDSILKYLVEHEKGLEINTAGLRKGLKQVHPYLDVLKRYKELGGEIVTVGSDAHGVDAIASNFDKAEEALKECGFKYYSIIENRIAEYKKLT
jgi:histidinol-phosphatase (PHP family)